jgi:hypothetical protein
MILWRIAGWQGFSNKPEATSDNDLYIGVPNPALRDQVYSSLFNLVSGHRGLEPQLGTAPLKPVKVVVEAKELSIPHSWDIVGEVAVEETLVEDRNPGFFNPSSTSLA